MTLVLVLQVGTHGIQIDFTEGGESYGATYLPEVAAEQGMRRATQHQRTPTTDSHSLLRVATSGLVLGWSHAETITELVAKSGYTGAVTAPLRAKIKLTRYQSQCATITYAEYAALRKQQPKAATAATAAAAPAPTANGKAK